MGAPFAGDKLLGLFPLPGKGRSSGKNLMALAFAEEDLIIGMEGLRPRRKRFCLALYLSRSDVGVFGREDRRSCFRRRCSVKLLMLLLLLFEFISFGHAGMPNLSTVTVPER